MTFNQIFFATAALIWFLISILECTAPDYKRSIGWQLLSIAACAVSFAKFLSLL